MSPTCKRPRCGQHTENLPEGRRRVRAQPIRAARSLPNPARGWWEAEAWREPPSAEGNGRGGAC